MKDHPWLWLSVAVNLLLAFTVGLLLRTRPGSAEAHPRRDRPAMAERPAAAPSRPLVVSGLGATAALPSVPAPDALAVEPLPPGAGGRVDLPTLVEHLRSSGLDEDSIASVVAAEVDRQVRQQQLELSRQVRRGEIDPTEQPRFYQQMQVTREQTLRSLLGEDAYRRWDKATVLQWLDLEGQELSPAETEAIYEAQRQRMNSNRELSLAFQTGRIDQYDYQQAMRNAETEYQNQLRKVLGAERQQDLSRSTDWTWVQVSRELRGLNLSSPQWTALQQAQQRYAAAQQDLQQQSAEGSAVSGQDWQEIQAAREREFERILGAQGYAEYRKLQDHRYKQLKQFAPAWQLSPSDIEMVYRKIQDYQQVAQDYRQAGQASGQAGETVDWQAINQEVRRLAEQTEAELRRYLGEERFARLQRAGITRFQ